jgi:hypothetical protein
MIAMPTKWLPAAVCNDMVLALRRDESPKTQTRRIIAGLPRDWTPCRKPLSWGPGDFAFYTMADPVGTAPTLFLPHWPVGVGLWVKEQTRQLRTVEQAVYQQPGTTEYVCDGRNSGIEWTAPKARGLPPMLMRRELARTLLTVTAVRAERVNEISERDALAEGVLPRELTPGGCLSALAAYHDLWDSLHGKKPGERFQDGPFVWVYELRRITTDFKEAQAILKGTAG